MTVLTQLVYRNYNVKPYHNQRSDYDRKLFCRRKRGSHSTYNLIG